MRTFSGGKLGRLLILDFERGEDLLDGTVEQLKKAGMKNAVLISGIGTFDKAHIHRVTSFNVQPDEEYIKIEGPMELSAIQGIVADGVPHFHTVFSDLEKTYSGHLESGCRVLYLAELMLAEVEGFDLEREFVGPLKLLTLKK